jgi:hypothetical protein
VAFTSGSDGGAAVSAFSATCTSSDGGTERTGSGATSPVSVEGLTAGAAYTCTVTATNAAGASSASAASVSFVVPDARTPVVLTYSGATRVLPGGALSVSATLKTQGGKVISSKQITFTLGGASVTALTNRSGIASTTITAPGTTGQYPLVSVFAGDGTYARKSATSTITVANKTATSLTYTGPTSAGRGVKITLSATLTGDGAGLSGQRVTFTFAGKSYAATTTGSGVASVAVTTPRTAGSYEVVVSFAGTSLWDGSAASATVVVG